MCCVCNDKSFTYQQSTPYQTEDQQCRPFEMNNSIEYYMLITFTPQQVSHSRNKGGKIKLRVFSLQLQRYETGKKNQFVGLIQEWGRSHQCSGRCTRRNFYNLHVPAYAPRLHILGGYGPRLALASMVQLDSTLTRSCKSDYIGVVTYVFTPCYLNERTLYYCFVIRHGEEST